MRGRYERTLIIANAENQTKWRSGSDDCSAGSTSTTIASSRWSVPLAKPAECRKSNVVGAEMSARVRDDWPLMTDCDAVVSLKRLALSLSLLVFAACEVPEPHVAAGSSRLVLIDQVETDNRFRVGPVLELVPSRAERLAEEHCREHGRRAQYSRRIDSSLVVYLCVK